MRSSHRLPSSSFPNFVWERTCLRNSVSQPGQQSCRDNGFPKQSLGTRRAALRCGAFLLLLAVATATAFGADDSAQEKHFLSNVRQLVFEGKRSGEGYFSPDGKKLI